MKHAISDRDAVDAFLDKAFDDLASATLAPLITFGDRFDLFKSLARDGPLTAGELAKMAKLDERYVLEWCKALTCAGYLENESDQDRFDLPAAHAPVLADEGGLQFLMPTYQQFLAIWDNVEAIGEAFQTGNGVPSRKYGPDFFEGEQRFSSAWYDNLLVQEWIPTMPYIQKRLEQGARVAEGGCGRGKALVTLAEAFPRSEFRGFDIHGPSVAAANQRAQDRGLDDRVRFSEHDISQELPGGKYDFAAVYDVLHDMADPAAGLTALRKSLRPDGSLLVLELNVKQRLQDMKGAWGAFLHSISVLYCMSVSLAQDGAGLGTAGLPEPKLRELADGAGFSTFRRLPIEDPFYVLYELKP